MLPLLLAACCASTKHHHHARTSGIMQRSPLCCWVCSVAPQSSAVTQQPRTSSDSLRWLRIAPPSILLELRRGRPGGQKEHQRFNIGTHTAQRVPRHADQVRKHQRFSIEAHTAQRVPRHADQVRKHQRFNIGTHTTQRVRRHMLTSTRLCWRGSHAFLRQLRSGCTCTASSHSRTVAQWLCAHSLIRTRLRPSHTHRVCTHTYKV